MGESGDDDKKMKHKELLFSHPLSPVSNLTLALALSHRLERGQWHVSGDLIYDISNFPFYD